MFVEVDLEVTTTEVVHNTPGANPVIVILLSALLLETEFVNTVALSRSLVTVTVTVTPADGNTDETFTMIGCAAPVTANTPPEPGSTFTVKAIEASATGAGGGVGVVVVPPLLHENIKNGIVNNNSFKFFIFYSFTILN